MRQEGGSVPVARSRVLPESPGDHVPPPTVVPFPLLRFPAPRGAMTLAESADAAASVAGDSRG